MKTKDKEKLLRETSLIKVNAYAPYSKFRVGAGVLLKNGEIITGVNVENSSYPCGVCAERSALTGVYSKGYRKEDILALALASDAKEFITPCGMCLQVISELMDGDCSVFLMNNKNEVKETKVKKLFPYAFSMDGIK